VRRVQRQPSADLSSVRTLLSRTILGRPHGNRSTAPLAPIARVIDARSQRDLRVFRAMQEGRIPAVEGMQIVALSGGWPIRTDNGFLFAAPIGDHGELALAGDFNDWNHARMERNDRLFWFHLPAKDEGTIPYKLVEGGRYFADPWARRYDFDENGEMSFAKTTKAHLERWPLKGEGDLAQRTVRVRVPSNVPTHHLYVHDGQNLFDPQGPYGGWRLQHALGDSTLAIGIDTTDRRFDELTWITDFVEGREVGGNGDAYARFIFDKIRPFIEREYGVPKKRGVLGSSLGGLMAYHQLLRDPDAFDFVASMSGTFGWGRRIGAQARMKDRCATFGPNDTRAILYLDSGGSPGRDNYTPTLELKDLLVQNGFEEGARLFYEHAQDAPHNEWAWAERVRTPISIFESLC
jgi:predicted alpha/beta superfamily hydrolase